MSRDSDIAPAVRKVRRNFSEKQITVFSSFNYRHSTELIQATTHHKTIKYKHIRTSLFPEEIYDVGGNMVVRRPEKYNPPNNNHC